MKYLHFINISPLFLYIASSIFNIPFIILSASHGFTFAIFHELPTMFDALFIAGHFKGK